MLESSNMHAVKIKTIKTCTIIKHHTTKRTISD